MKSTRTLIDELKQELERNKELLGTYQQIPTGWFGAAMIKQKIDFAERALADQDTVGMIQALAQLRLSK